MVQLDKALTRRSGDGHPIPVIGKCTARVSITQRICPIELVVMRSCSYDVIILWDFLTALMSLLTVPMWRHLFSKLPIVDCMSSPSQRARSVITLWAERLLDETVLALLDRRSRFQWRVSTLLSLVTLREGSITVWAANDRDHPRLLPWGKHVTSYGFPAFPNVGGHLCASVPGCAPVDSHEEIS